MLVWTKLSRSLRMILKKGERKRLMVKNLLYVCESTRKYFDPHPFFNSQEEPSFPLVDVPDAEVYPSLFYNCSKLMDVVFSLTKKVSRRRKNKNF